MKMKMIDEFAKRHGLSVDCMKIDVEGMLLVVVRGDSGIVTRAVEYAHFYSIMSSRRSVICQIPHELAWFMNVFFDIACNAIILGFLIGTSFLNTRACNWIPLIEVNCQGSQRHVEALF
jgi:hypothetical protein